METVELYDTTLRDGAQSWGITFSLEDKIRISQKLDELGIDLIEGGYPGSNPKDRKFFESARELAFKHAQVVAFGSTCRVGLSPENDPQLQALIDTRTQVVTIVGKTWDLHVKEIISTTKSRNLEMIRESVAYLKPYFRRIIYDAEHFFDGFKSNPEYALETIKVARSAGAALAVLCDTNGGTLPTQIVSIIKKVREAVETPLGIHAHNDSDTAVANTLLAVEAGVTQVQGTINGIGERCGNANLISIIPALSTKMGKTEPDLKQLGLLKHVSEFVDEMANRKPVVTQPYVGAAAFAHKGGLHSSAVIKNPRAYEHLDPAIVGSKRSFPISEQSGRASVLRKAARYGIDLKPDDPMVDEILKTIKDLEAQGAHYDIADGSFELLMKRILGIHKKFFSLHGFQVIDVKREGDTRPFSDAIVRIVVGDKMEFSAAEGNGPVNALDLALRKALESFYPIVKEAKLTDFKVRVLEGTSGTGATVRVLIETSDGEDTWWTVGFNDNIIQASWNALVDSIDYKLQKDLANDQ
ncbi:citramalate synthase [Thermodesulfobacteriota bacterium]